VWFGGGAEQFYPGKDSYQGKDYYAEFAKAGYDVSLNKTSLLKLGNNKKALGIFCRSHMPVWLDRNVYKKNLGAFTNDPLGSKSPALDLPGLKEMTLKAIDILHRRGGDKGFFLMSEGASIDKQMHTLDYDRALGVSTFNKTTQISPLPVASLLYSRNLSIILNQQLPSAMAGRTPR